MLNTTHEVVNNREVSDSLPNLEAQFDHEGGPELGIVRVGVGTRGLGEFCHGRRVGARLPTGHITVQNVMPRFIR